MLAHFNTWWCIKDIRKKIIWPWKKKKKIEVPQIFNIRGPNGPWGFWLNSTPAYLPRQVNTQNVISAFIYRHKVDDSFPHGRFVSIPQDWWLFPRSSSAPQEDGSYSRNLTVTEWSTMAIEITGFLYKMNLIASTIMYIILMDKVYCLKVVYIPELSQWDETRYA